MKQRTLLESVKQKFVQFRISEKDWIKIQKLANKYAGGNVSEWLRYKALQDEKKS